MDKATMGASKALNESLSRYTPERKQHPFTEDARYKAKNLTEANGDGIKTMYDGSKWLVQTPTTEKGAEKLAEGTKWLNSSYDSYYDFEDYGKDLCVLTNKTNPQEKYYYAPWFDERTGEGGIEVLADINDKHIHDEVGFFMNDTELCSVPRIAKDLMIGFGFAPTDKGVEFGITGDDVEYCLQSDKGGNLGLFLEPNYSEEALKVLPAIIERHIQENPTSVQGKTDGGISESVVAKAIAEVTIDNIRDCVWDDVVQTVAKDWRSYFRGLLGGNVSISHFNERWGSVFNVEIPDSCLPAMLSWMMSSPTFDCCHIAQKMFEGARCALIDSLKACIKENNIKFDADKAIENAVAYQFKENKIDWNAVNREIAKSTPVRESISRAHRGYTKEDYSARPLRPLRPELLQSIKNRYPNGTRVELIQMEDIQAPPIGTKGTVYYVDDMGDLGVKWDNGSTLNVIYGVDSVKRINESRIQKPYRRYMTESRRTYNRNYRRPIRR